MLDRGKFLITLKSRVGAISQNQLTGLDAILDAIIGAPLAYMAYMLATAWHETNRTMQPVKEAYWLPESWRQQHLRYFPYYGRGYVQLTWLKDYQVMDAALAAAKLITAGALIANPDLAMRPDVAAFIMRYGMEHGSFTGVTLAACLPAAGVASTEQYIHARTIINGHDRDVVVEGYAQVFERALRDGGLS